ncbi:MAG: hypothetical protein PF445_04815, partial [Melioribacteraceae bacterium]|nr:hypothetical protein [Melioribacteraceae bacterium]
MKNVFIILLSLFTTFFAQDEVNEIDIFVIDSYVAPETPHKIMLTFFTSESVKANINFDGNDEIEVSSEYLEEHRFEMLLSKLNYDSTSIPYKIIGENGGGLKSSSE